jgi:TetR/AcrR family transcriptional regulator of autoinduction and epiphytic fitness
MSDVNTDPPRAGTRRDRARATRQRIAASAFELFSANGYAGTTMDGIARAAGVAVQTVYFTFHTKAEVLIEALTVAGGGPGSDSDVMSRSWVHEALSAQDPGRRLALIVEHGTEIYRRIGPMFRAVSAAASVDPDVDEAWKRVVAARRAGMRQMMERMDALDEIRPGLGVKRATDIMSAVNRHEVFLAFTEESGWSVAAYKAWTFATLVRQLLVETTAAGVLRPGSGATTGMSFEADLRDLPI